MTPSHDTIIMGGSKEGAGRGFATLTVTLTTRLCFLRDLSSNQLASVPSGIFDKLISLLQL